MISKVERGVEEKKAREQRNITKEGGITERSDSPIWEGKKERRVGQQRWTTSQARVVKVKAVVVRSDKAAVVMYRRVVAGAMDGRLDRRRSLGQHREMPVERR